MQRRVVVTGLGLICGVGNTAEEVWQGLLAGKSGMAPITGFDATAFSTTFAAEVKNFDPLQFIEKKELKKMGRFIHLALAASDEAMKTSSLEVTPEYGHEEYRTKVQSHITQLQDRVRGAGMDYHLLVTDQPLDGALRQYLTLRQGRY